MQLYYTMKLPSKFFYYYYYFFIIYLIAMQKMFLKRIKRSWKGKWK